MSCLRFHLGGDAGLIFVPAELGDRLCAISYALVAIHNKDGIRNVVREDAVHLVYSILNQLLLVTTRFLKQVLPTSIDKRLLMPMHHLQKELPHVLIRT